MLRYDDHDCGFSWMPDDPLRRTSHALDTPGGVWLIDPVDEREALERATSLGSPAGVVQLLDRHARDCAFIAARLGVPHLRIPREIPGSPFTVVPVLRVPRWREVALWWPEQRALVVAEALGTTPIHRLDTGAAGVHPLLRILAPLRAGAPARGARARRPRPGREDGGHRRLRAIAQGPAEAGRPVPGHGAVRARVAALIGPVQRRGATARSSCPTAHALPRRPT
jgi:hypothetical protein